METVNLNSEVIIYPNKKGWVKMVECYHKYYNQYASEGHLVVTWEDTKNYIESRKTEDGGFKEQLWVIMATYHDMFFNGTPYWENMNLTIVPDPYDVLFKELRKPKNKIKRWIKKFFK